MAETTYGDIGPSPDSGGITREELVTDEHMKRRWRLMERLRRHTIRLRRMEREDIKEEKKAERDATGTLLFALMARMAVRMASNREPTAVRRRAKRRQLMDRISSLRYRTGV